MANVNLGPEVVISPEFVKMVDKNLVLDGKMLEAIAAASKAAKDADNMLGPDGDIAARITITIS